jgi:FAD dependent oxidoreductase
VGSEVFGLEQLQWGHSRGASQDYSRVIRLTYHLERYTHLGLHTYSAWAELDKESAVQVVTKTGGIQAAFKASRHAADIEAYAYAMGAANVPFERFDRDELRRRFPQFRCESEVDVLYEWDTGIADASRGNAANVALAHYHDATILEIARYAGYARR